MKRLVHTKDDNYKDLIIILFIWESLQESKTTEQYRGIFFHIFFSAEYSIHDKNIDSKSEPNQL